MFAFVGLMHDDPANAQNISTNSSNLPGQFDNLNRQSDSLSQIVSFDGTPRSIDQEVQIVNNSISVPSTPIQGPERDSLRAEKESYESLSNAVDYALNLALNGEFNVKFITADSELGKRIINSSSNDLFNPNTNMHMHDVKSISDLISKIPSAQLTLIVHESTTEDHVLPLIRLTQDTEIDFSINNQIEKRTIRAGTLISADADNGSVRYIEPDKYGYTEPTALRLDANFANFLNQGDLSVQEGEFILTSVQKENGRLINIVSEEGYILVGTVDFEEVPVPSGLNIRALENPTQVINKNGFSFLRQPFYFEESEDSSITWNPRLKRWETYLNIQGLNVNQNLPFIVTINGDELGVVWSGNVPENLFSNVAIQSDEKFAILPQATLGSKPESSTVDFTSNRGEHNDGGEVVEPAPTSVWITEGFVNSTLSIQYFLNERASAKLTSSETITLKDGTEIKSGYLGSFTYQDVRYEVFSGIWMNTFHFVNQQTGYELEYVAFGVKRSDGGVNIVIARNGTGNDRDITNFTVELHDPAKLSQLSQSGQRVSYAAVFEGFSPQTQNDQAEQFRYEIIREESGIIAIRSDNAPIGPAIQALKNGDPLPNTQPRGESVIHNYADIVVIKDKTK